jgi:hypothetical protein
VINATGLGKNGAIERVAKEAPAQTKLLGKMATGIDKLVAAGGPVELAPL